MLLYELCDACYRGEKTKEQTKLFHLIDSISSIFVALIEKRNRNMLSKLHI